MSIDMTALSAGSIEFASLLVNLILPVLPWVIGAAVAGFVITIFFSLPKIIRGSFKS